MEFVSGQGAVPAVGYRGLVFGAGCGLVYLGDGGDCGHGDQDGWDGFGVVAVKVAPPVDGFDSV